jgi:hypothetical protein
MKKITTLHNTLYFSQLSERIQKFKSNYEFKANKILGAGLKDN